MGRSVIIDGIEVSVLRRPDTRTMRLKMDRKTGKPVVTAPLLCLTGSIKKFIQQHAVWLRKQIELTPLKTKFCDGLEICLLGQHLTISHQPTRRGGVFTELGKLVVTGEAAHIHRRVSDFIKEQTKSYATTQAKALAKQTGVSVKNVTVRDTVSRWGSCSSGGGLSFCWRLGLAPLFVLDYVIAHEVMHLSEMNHSWAFWKKLKDLNDDVAAAKKWLETNGPSLHRYD